MGGPKSRAGLDFYGSRRRVDS